MNTIFPRQVGLLNRITCQQPLHVYPKLPFRFRSTIYSKSVEVEMFASHKILANRKISQLAFSYVILQSCTFKIVFKFGLPIFEKLRQMGLTAPLDWLIRRSYFKYFTAGDTLDECIETCRELSQEKISSILDYSVEHCDDADAVVDTLLQVIRACQTNDFCKFACLKFTALLPLSTLMELNKIVVWYENHPDVENPLMAILEHENPRGHIEEMIEKSNHLEKFEESPPQLSTDLLKALLSTIKRLDILIDELVRSDAKILIDAEQYCIQRSINFLAWYAMKCGNKHKPLVFNTFQIYLKESLANLAKDLELSKKYNIKFAAKIVRGAYMESELEYAMKNNTEYPIFDTIEETHHSYNTATDMLLKCMKNGNTSIMIASHNEKSVALALDKMQEYNLEPNSDVWFAQLHGMCDHISLLLVEKGYNACKYVPFGPYESVIPFLIRRIQENHTILASCACQKRLLLEEMSSRLWPLRRIRLQYPD